MFRSIYIFLLVFPFLIFPVDKYVSLGKMILLVYLCLAIWIFIFLKVCKRKELPFQNKLYLSELFLLLFAVWAALSAILSDHPYVSMLGDVGRHEGILSLYSYFTIFFIAFRLSPIEKYTIIMKWFVGMSMISGIYGFLQKNLLSFLPFLDGTGKIESFFGNANFYGSYLVIMLFLTIILTLTTNIRKKIVLLFIAANFLFLNLLYTETRSALVGIFMGIVFLTPFIWSKFPKLRKRYAGLLLSFIILFGVVNMVGNNVYLQRVFSIFTGAGQVVKNDKDAGLAGSYRWKLWEIAMPLVTEYPVFGSGPDTLGYVYDQKAFRQYTHIHKAIINKAHNEYLQIAITMGIPALIFYLLFLGAIFWGIWKAIWKSTGEKQLILAGFLALVIAYAVQAFFNISVVPVAPFFWFMLGMAYRLSTVMPRNVED